VSQIVDHEGSGLGQVVRGAGVFLRTVVQPKRLKALALTLLLHQTANMGSSGLDRGDRGRGRSFELEGERWSVSERDAQRVPGARAPTCLIFESEGAVRRSWSVPSNWRDMDDAALWRLSELTASASRIVQALETTFISSIVAQKAASEMIRTARGSLQENRALRKQSAEIIRQCRATRQESHSGVTDYARQARANGASESDVLETLDTPLRHAAFVMDDPQRTARLASDIARWCHEEFRAA
jgi:hypothetical protein